MNRSYIIYGDHSFHMFSRLFSDYSPAKRHRAKAQDRRGIGLRLYNIGSPDPIHTESEAWRKIAGTALFLVQRLGRGAEGGSARIVLMGPGLLK